MEKFEVISKDYYSNCIIEALKAKIKNHKVKLIVVMPWDNVIFCPHAMWSDGIYDYDFGNESRGDKMLKDWTLHKGHVRKYSLGFAKKYKSTCEKWSKMNR